MQVCGRIVLLIAALLLAATLVPPGAASRAQVAASRTSADNWTDAVSELAAKILSHSAPQGAVALSVRNVSSLSDEDVSQIRRELRSQLRSRGVRLAGARQASAEIPVTLSENLEGLVWIAEIQNGASHDVVMITVARPKPEFTRPTEALSIRKVRIYEQADPVLDFVPLDTLSVAPSAPPGTAAAALVLSLGAVSLYEKAVTGPNEQVGTQAWQLKQSAPLARSAPWPRDARGRLVIGPGNSFNVFLPGMKCSGTIAPALRLDCHEGDEPWPLGGTGALPPAGATTSPRAVAYFAVNRNFFDGRIGFDDGRETKAAPFFSAAAIPTGAAGPARGGNGAASDRLWLLTGLDGRAQLLNANAESVGSVEGLGSDVVSIQTGCHSGWQVLASGPGNSDDSDVIQAYEIVNRKAVAAGLPADFAGPLTALWPLANGSEAVAIFHNLKTASYEVFRLSITCGQ